MGRKANVNKENENMNTTMENKNEVAVKEGTISVDAVFSSIGANLDDVSIENVSSAISMASIYESADTITKQSFIKIEDGAKNSVINALKETNKVSDKADYVKAILCNTLVKNSDSASDTVKELAEILDTTTNKVNKYVRIADKFLKMSIPCSVNKVKTKDKDGKEIETELAVQNYSALLDNITSAKVETVEDVNGFQFRWSALEELERVDSTGEKAIELINNGDIDASTSNKSIRDKVDEIKGKKSTDKDHDGKGDKNDKNGFECKTDKERLNLAIKLIKACTTETLKENKKYTETIETIETWLKYVK